jgi:hypothetical protein
MVASKLSAQLSHRVLKTLVHAQGQLIRRENCFQSQVKIFAARQTTKYT